MSLLIVETGAITYTEKFTVRVFVDKPDADRQTSLRDLHYVGRIQALDSASRANEAGQDATHVFSMLLLPSDPRFYDLVTPGAAFSVTLVPVGPGQTDQSFRIPVKTIALKIY